MRSRTGMVELVDTKYLVKNLAFSSNPGSDATLSERLVFFVAQTEYSTMRLW